MDMNSSWWHDIIIVSETGASQQTNTLKVKKEKKINDNWIFTKGEGCLLRSIDCLVEYISKYNYCMYSLPDIVLKLNEINN